MFKHREDTDHQQIYSITELEAYLAHAILLPKAYTAYFDREKIPLEELAFRKSPLTRGEVQLIDFEIYVGHDNGYLKTPARVLIPAVYTGKLGDLKPLEQEIYGINLHAGTTWHETDLAFYTPVLSPQFFLLNQLQEVSAYTPIHEDQIYESICGPNKLHIVAPRLVSPYAGDLLQAEIAYIDIAPTLVEEKQN